MDLVHKLLAVTTENGATENEAITAALKVQRILAKYDMKMSDVVEVDEKEPIVEHAFDAGHKSWKYSLAKVIADNFCCRVYTKNKSSVIFYGYERHSSVACEVFKSIYRYGNRKAAALYTRYSRSGRPTKGIQNQFLIGFVDGVKQALEKQCTALALVIPEEVQNAYTKDVLSKARCLKVTTNFTKDDSAYTEGVSAGRHSVQDRTLGCC